MGFMMNTGDEPLVIGSDIISRLCDGGTLFDSVH